MGWVSLLEDNLERIQDNIRLAEAALKDKAEFVEEHRADSLKALSDAQAILSRAWSHLELATAPELDLALEVESLRSEISQMKGELGAANQAVRKAELAAANDYAELQDAKRDLKDLRKRHRKLGRDFEKVAGKDFASAVDAYPPPSSPKNRK